MAEADHVVPRTDHVVPLLALSALAREMVSTLKLEGAPMIRLHFERENAQRFDLLFPPPSVHPSFLRFYGRLFPVDVVTLLFL